MIFNFMFIKFDLFKKKYHNEFIKKEIFKEYHI